MDQNIAPFAWILHRNYQYGTELLKVYDAFRFGKRSDSSQSDSDSRYALLQGTDDSASRLSLPRY